jgi:hypothetical protein
MRTLNKASLIWLKQLLITFLVIFTLNSCKEKKEKLAPSSLKTHKQLNNVNNSADEVWHTANLTNYESYPAPGSPECIDFNGCEYQGKFAFLDGTMSESWVQANNIAAIHSKDAGIYKLKTLRLRQGSNEIDVKVYDQCSDSDCNGCCTDNAYANGQSFLIDIEKYTMGRFGPGSGIVEWRCLDCD